MELHLIQDMGSIPHGFTSELFPKERIQICIEWIGISWLLSWLFYDSGWMILLFLPGVVIWGKYRKGSFEVRRRYEYAEQFAEGLSALSSAVSVGYSAESAVCEAVKSLRMIYGKDNEMIEEFQRIMVQLSMNRALEELIYDMATRSNLEDALSFAEVFRTARRNGGNLARIMENTAKIIDEKTMLNREIQVLLAGKRYEQKIMCLIPFAMIMYLRFGSPGYMDVLYHSAAGVVVMSFCLGIYGIAVYWGSKVLAIEV